MANIKELSDEELEKKIKSAKVAVERNTGLILEAAKKKLAKLESELESRAKEVKKEVKEEAKDVKKDVEEAVEKVVDKTEDKKPSKKKADKKKEKKEAKEETKSPFKSKKFRNKKTGEIVTKVPLTKIKDYEEVKEGEEEKTDKKSSKTTSKKSTEKKEDKKEEKPKEKFELTIDGQKYEFSDKASKDACEKAMKALKGRYKEVEEHKEATEKGIEKAKSIPVTQRISDGFVSIAKKAVSEVPKIKIEKKPDDVRKEIDAVEKAFENLFDKLSQLMGKEIPKSQRKQIMDILTKFESGIDKDADKKSKATTKVRKKEDGGMAGDSKDIFGAGNKYSYASFM